jgi:hypothetical protein
MKHSTAYTAMRSGDAKTAVHYKVAPPACQDALPHSGLQSILLPSMHACMPQCVNLPCYSETAQISISRAARVAAVLLVAHMLALAITTQTQDHQCRCLVRSQILCRMSTKCS